MSLVLTSPPLSDATSPFVLNGRVSLDTRIPKTWLDPAESPAGCYTCFTYSSRIPSPPEFGIPVDYMANQNDPWFLHQYGSYDIHLATGCGPLENSGSTYRMSAVLASRGIAYHLDDWGEGGHE